MKFVCEVKDCKIQSLVNLPNGFYEVNIREKDKSRTYEQIKKLWATIDEISKVDYGDTSQSQNIYFQILQMAGIETDILAVQEKAYKSLLKKVKCCEILSKEVIDHVSWLNVRVCFKGISEMSKAELSKVIEVCVKYASEKGVIYEQN